MKKALFLILAAAVMTASCRQENKPVDGTVPEIRLNVSGDFVVPAEGGDTVVAYTVMNPVQGGELVPYCDDEWVSGLSCESSGIVFSVSPNDGDQSRSTVISVVYQYGDSDTVMADFTLVQKAKVAVDEEYDYVLEAEYLSGTYFGSLYGLNGEHCYDIYLSDKPMSADGFLLEGGTYYLFDIFTDAPSDPMHPQPVSGTYVLGQSEATDAMTFTREVSCRLYQSDAAEPMRLKFAEGTLEISQDGDNMVFDAVLTDVDGETHHVTYSGPADYTSDNDDELLLLEQDLDIKTVIYDASWMANVGTEIMEVNFAFTDMTSDEYGYVVPPGSILYVDAFMPFSQEGAVTTGRYDFTHEINTLNALYPGGLYEIMAGMWYPAGTYADYMDETGKSHTGLIEEGYMEISGAPGNYSVECSFTTVDGYSVTCTYSGDLTVRNVPQPFSTLEGDHTLDLSNSAGIAEFYGDYYGTGGANWIIAVEPVDRATGDGFMADIVTTTHSFADGIPTGKYRLASGVYPAPGEYAPGAQAADGSLVGTMYFGDYDYMPGYGEFVNAYAPAVSGDLQITDNGDGTYGIVFDFVDDKGNSWDGEWSGELEMRDASMVSYGTDAQKVSRSRSSASVRGDGGAAPFRFRAAR
ncbi:MAG TPA: hypothetical protein IAC03_05930 [Candidatus Coprenecus pullistercoris]|nr:hypothetical protein [Candidatus Coprenecus pullistercoris]